MVGSAKKHVDELLKLPPDERSEAAEALLLSLEQEPETGDQAVVAAAWAREIERRIAENEPGVPAETVFAEGRARLQKRS
jgi:putative addiction module component (TIGR02574 family)